MHDDTLGDIANALSNLESSDTLKELIEKAVLGHVSAVEILHKSLRVGLEEVGRKYEAGEFFLSELLYSGMLMTEALDVLEPYLKTGKRQTVGEIVLGTVRGDMHDLGKNIFRMLVQGAGFEVHDLGVDVPSEVFVNKLNDAGAGLLGLSALLTTTIPEMGNVIVRLKEVGMRNKVKVVLGGNAVTEDFGVQIGSDAVASDAVEGVALCKKWVSENK